MTTPISPVLPGGPQNSQRMPSAVRMQLLRVLQKQLFEQLETGIKTVFKEADDALFDSANDAPTNELRRSLLEGFNTLRALRKGIAETFFKEHQGAFKAYFEGRTEQLKRAAEQEGGEGKSTLSLLRTEEYEESLLVTTMTNKLQKQYGLDLVVLRRRLQSLVGAEYTDDTQSPFCPETVINSFYQGLQQADLPLSIKTTLYLQFDSHVLGAMPSLYQTLEALFIKHKVLPELSVEQVMAEMASAQRAQLEGQQGAKESEPADTPAEDVHAADAHSAHAPQAPEPSSHGGARQAAQTKELGTSSPQRMDAANAGSNSPFQEHIEQQIAEINQLLGNYRNVLGTVLPSGSRMLDSFAPATAKQAYSNQQILHALQRMQREHANASVAEQQDSDQFKQEVYEALSAANENAKDFRVGDHETNLIDLVGMLFDFVKEEDNLADENKNALVNLQNLYCQVALKDESFFQNVEHPAHLLLNKMVQAGSEFYGTTEEPMLSTAIVQTVQHALTDYMGGEQLFKQLLERFNVTVEAAKQRVHLREQRAVEAAKGREKLVLARKHARGFIEVCLQRYAVPELIQEFLRSAWADVLVFVFLRTGPSSPQWQAKAKVADQLAWSCTPLSGAEQKKLLREQKPLLAAVQQGLEMLGCHSESEINRLLEDLLICQQAVQAREEAVANSLTNTLQSPNVDVADALEDEIPVLVDIKQDDAALTFAHQLRNVRFGTFFEFTEPPHRLKLAWFSPTTHRYMFVDQSGQGSYIKTWNQLLALMESGDAKIEDEPARLPFFERGLLAIQRTLQRFMGNYVEDAVRQLVPKKH